MAVTPTFPSREALRSFRFRPLDAVVGLGVFLLVYAVIRVGASARVPFHPGRSAVTISTAPAELPFYAARSLLRMFIALFFSYSFSLVYAYVAARSRRARRIMIPALDILQSVPVLGFLAVILGTLNVVGGFVVTDRMLEMFKGKPDDRARPPAAKAEDATPSEPSEPSGGAS